jgi:hypothetical protein
VNEFTITRLDGIFALAFQRDAVVLNHRCDFLFEAAPQFSVLGLGDVPNDLLTGFGKLADSLIE